MLNMELVYYSGHPYIVVTLEIQTVGCYTEVVCLYSGTNLYIVVTLETQPVGYYTEVVYLYSGT